ncbi:uncharacterized protein LOC111632247 isoform X1 [Centruroides sculpturatus]|uniref:uncharacterized protein LOC111632247 isoform X1 n=1 Tax=Centruroides sculpturatus TaxID=218467 RepID=UPI000C6DB7EC|nr:uncharacterized protein LOC111632247 isoform X1 [Centruroides sculpturatus]
MTKKENVKDELESLSSFSQCRAEYVLQNLPNIVKYILDCLNNEDLIRCKRVCTLWKNIASEILRNRVIFVTKHIPKDVQMKSILSPDMLLPYIKKKCTKQLIPEIIISELPNCKTCDDFARSSDKFTRFFKAVSYALSLFNIQQFFLSARQHSFEPPSPLIHSSEPPSPLISTQLAVIPSLPKIRVHRFSLTSREIQENIINGMTDLSEIIDIPREELKCILWFVDGEVEQRVLNVMPRCPFAGISSCEGTPETYTALAFSGEGVNAFSFVLTGEEGLETKIKAQNAEETFKHFKSRYEINQRKCVAFIFCSYICKCNLALTLNKFEEYFPNLPILFYYNCRFFGANCIPKIKEKQENFIFTSSGRPWHIGTLVLVWFN